MIRDLNTLKYLSL